MKLIQKRVILEGEQTPAKLVPEIGTIFLNIPIWDKLPTAYKEFILLHEEGHFVLNTYNEFEADKYAFERYAGTHKGSLQEIWNTLISVLPCTTAEQCNRLNTLYAHIMKYNYDKTKNPIYLKELERFNKEYKNLKVTDMINFIGRSFYGGEVNSYGANYNSPEASQPIATQNYYPMNPPPPPQGGTGGGSGEIVDGGQQTGNPGTTNPNPPITETTANDAITLLKNTKLSDIPEMFRQKDYRPLIILGVCGLFIYLLIRR